MLNGNQADGLRQKDSEQKDSAEAMGDTISKARHTGPAMDGGLPFIPYLAMILGLHLWHSPWLSFLLYHGAIVVILVMESPGRYARSLIRGWDKRIGWGAVAFGLAGGVLLKVLAPLAGIDGAGLRPVLGSLGLRGMGWPLFVVYHTLANPWFEEVFWRGRLGHDSRRPVLNDFLFAGYHMLVLMLFLDWPWLVPAFGILAVAGWLWRQLRRECGGLLTPVISHLAADGSIMIAVYWLAR
ncbi:hypothetical protein CSB20_04620 [bacterium DOLZORAL124_64_63]|nr:MAG: hypothetical protein CSB20_04620 [bacterium DOLZORAL124_64_63]